MATANTDSIAPVSIIIPTKTPATGITTPQTGQIVLSGVYMYYYSGTAWTKI